MATPTEQDLVVLPHFKPEEVEALKAEHERRKAVFKGHALLDNDDERIRDAVQREQYWRAQIAHLESLGVTEGADYQHAHEELAHCLFTQGHIGDALALAKNPERIAHYESTHAAIVRADDEDCGCPTQHKVQAVKGDKTEEHTTEARHIVGHYPSARHGGRMTPIKRCSICGHTNIAR